MIDVGIKLVHLVARCASEYYYKSITIDDIQGSSRIQGVKVARQLAAYILMHKFNMGCVKIGRMLNKDHTTILHSWHVVQNALDIVDQEYCELYDMVCSRMDTLTITRRRITSSEYRDT